MLDRSAASSTGDLARVWTSRCACGRRGIRLLRTALGTGVRLSLLALGTLPVAEHKPRLVYRARPGEPLPPEIAAARPKGGS